MYKYIIAAVLGVTLLSAGTAHAGGGETLWQWPISNPHILNYWHHRGADLFGQADQAVHPVFQGTVVQSTCAGKKTYGCYVIIQHERYEAGDKGTYYYDHYKTVYAHLKNINVAVGDKVDTATVLGTVGTKGHGTKHSIAPHVHFEIRYNDGETKRIIKGWHYLNYFK